MTPSEIKKAQKALELVGKYARLTKDIKFATRRIGYHLGSCKGVSGKRLELQLSWNDDDPVKVDGKGRELDIHLVNWYTAERDGYGLYLEQIIDAEHKEICPHCYAAHLEVSARKAMRKELGSVKRSMSRIAA